MAKNLESYRLGVVIDGDAAKGLAALRATDAQVAKTQTGLGKLKADFKAALGGDTGAGAALGQRFSTDFVAGVSGGLKNIGQTLGTLIGTGIAPGIGTAVGSLIGSGIDKAMGVAAGAIQGLITQGVDLNIFLEKAEVHFTALAGSVEKARTHLELMDKLEGQLGFDMRELVSQSQRLSEFNIPLSKMELYLRASADAAHAFGSGAEGFATIANTLGLMTEKGELSAKMLLKLEKQGVPAMKYLAEATGLNAKQLKALADAGRLNGEVASEMIAKGIELHKGGAAQRIIEQTTYGQQFRFEQNVEQTAGRATRSFTRDGLKGLYATGNAALESDMAQGLAGSINSTIEGVVNSLKRGVAVGQTGGIGAGLKSIGGDVVGGLYAGIKGAEGLIAESSQWISDTLVGFTKKAFGIQSPSQVTRDQIGKPLGEGVVAGLKDTSSEIYKAMQDIVAGAIDAGKATITGRAARKQAMGTGADFSKFQSIADSTGIPLNLLLAIGSRETNLKNILGDYRGGQYHGAGYMQVDVGTDKGFVQSGAWKNAEAAVSRGAEIFMEKLNWLLSHEGKTASVRGHKFTVPKLEGEALIQTAVAMYNSGLNAVYSVSQGLSPDARTTGKNYSADVLGRAKLLTGFGGASAASAPTGTTASPVAVTATASAPLPVKMIFGGGVDAGTTLGELAKVSTELATVVGALNLRALEAMPTPPALSGAGAAGGGGVFGGPASAAQRANRDKLVRKRAGGIFAGIGGSVIGAATDEDGNLSQGASASQHAAAAMEQSFKKVGEIGKQAIGGLATGVGSLVSNFVLMGETGPAALKKMTAQVLASAASEAAVEAIMQLAYGFATMFTDPAESAGHFTSAAIFGSVAAATGIAGRALAGNSFNGKGGASGGSAGQPNPWLGSEGYAANRFTSDQSGTQYNPTRIGYTMSKAAMTGGQDQNTALLQSINNKLNPVNGQQMVLATLSKNPQAVGSAVTAGLNSNNQLSLRLGQRIAA